MKKILIIGGGISGISAGIYAQKAGFESVIYEKNKVAGGQCMGWNRREYHIDNCMHWLTGTKEGTGLRKLWEDLGALGDKVNFIKTEKFYSSELDGKQVTLWRDLLRTEKELLEISPEDAEEIHEFISYVKLAECCEMPVEKPMDMMGIKDYINLGKKMSGMIKVIRKYGKINIEDMSKRFKSPLLQRLITDYLPKEYIASSFIASFATVVSGNGELPAGGSLAMTNRMIDRYKKLGGLIHTGISAEKVKINDNKADGIILSDGTFDLADYVICATDTAEAFGKLIGKSYMNKAWETCYRSREDYPLFSSFQMAFSIDSSAFDIDNTLFFNCEPLTVGKTTVQRMSVKSYSYEPSFAPQGKTVLQANIMQEEDDYLYWKSLDKDQYKKQKSYAAQEVMERIVQRFPKLNNCIELLDSWTPLTYEHYCNSYRGAYMSFISKKNIKAHRFTGKLKGLSNVFLASQWMMAPGGLPVAASEGKFAVQRILKAEKMSYEL